MLITRKWLEKYIDIKNINNKEITTAFNSLGFEVENELDLNSKNSELVLGYITDSKKIENTKLSLNIVDIGTDKLEIICGAQNARKDIYVIVAKIGAQISNWLAISERTIQNHKSYGMLCGLEEIGINKSILSDNEKNSIYEVEFNNLNLSKYLGKDIKKIINLDDYIWDVDLTINRSDALALFQLLKEIANYFNIKINWFKTNLKSTINNNDIKIDIDNKIIDNVNSLTYSNIIIANQTFLDSSDDILLKNNNIKKENQILDISKKVTIQTGQPIIILDFDKLNTKEIYLKKIKIDNYNDEVFALVDNKDNLLNVIGLETEQNYIVDKNTNNILVIYLSIDTSQMRKQFKILNNNNVLLQRFIKYLNPNLYKLANDNFIYELEQYNLLKEISDIKTIKKYKVEKKLIDIKLEDINNLIGYDFNVNQIINLFKYLDIKVTNNENILSFEIDENRIDIFNKNDIAEEVARLYGYNNIPEIAPVIFAKEHKKNLKEKLEDKITNYLIGLNFYNVKSYSLVEKENNDNWNLFNINNEVKILNPLSKLREVYRNNISKSLIDISVFNSSISNKKIKIFEIANIYSFNDYNEKHLSWLTTGDIYNDIFNKEKITSNYYYNKSIFEAILKTYNIDINNISYVPIENVNKEIHPFINCNIKYLDNNIGYIYKLNPQFETKNKISETIVVEINLDMLFEVSNKIIVNTNISKFQESSRNITIELPSQIDFKQFVTKITKNIKYLNKTTIIDNFINDKLQSENKNAVTIEFLFNDVEKQLTDVEINDQLNIIIQNINKLNIKIR